jgi:hypothetical protein
VLPGLALTLAPVDALNAVFGVQVYVVAPLPVNVVELPEQIVAPALIPNVGVGLTVTITVAGFDAEQPAAVPMTVYVVVIVGEALTTAPVEALNVPLGVHV